MQILVADGHLGFVTALTRSLHKHRHQAEGATDALTCLALLREMRPQALLLGGDLLWGGSDGILEAVQEDPWLADTPVLLLIDGDDQRPYRRHPMVISTARRGVRMDDLVRQLEFVALLHGPIMRDSIRPSWSTMNRHMKTQEQDTAQRIGELIPIGGRHKSF